MRHLTLLSIFFLIIGCQTIAYDRWHETDKSSTTEIQKYIDWEKAEFNSDECTRNHYRNCQSMIPDANRALDRLEYSKVNKDSIDDLKKFKDNARSGFYNREANRAILKLSIQHDLTSRGVTADQTNIISGSDTPPVYFEGFETVSAPIFVFAHYNPKAISGVDNILSLGDVFEFEKKRDYYSQIQKRKFLVIKVEYKNIQLSSYDFNNQVFYADLGNTFESRFSTEKYTLYFTGSAGKIPSSFYFYTDVVRLTEPLKIKMPPEEAENFSKGKYSNQDTYDFIAILEYKGSKKVIEKIQACKHKVYQSCVAEETFSVLVQYLEYKPISIIYISKSNKGNDRIE